MNAEAIKNFLKKNKIYLGIAAFFFLIIALSFPFSALFQSDKEVKKEDEKNVYKIYALDKSQENLKEIKIGTPTRYTDEYSLMVVYKDGKKEDFKISFAAYNFISTEVLNKIDLSKVRLEYLSQDDFLALKTKEEGAEGFSVKFLQAYSDKLGQNLSSFSGSLVAVLPILLIGLLVFLMAKQMGLLVSDLDILMPEDIEGSIDELIGMEDIKKEVLQLKDMYEQREKYQRHDLYKSFNIMFTGPAGTGKTKLAGYLAKELNMPIIIGSAASLETGFVAGGAHRLKSIYAKAVKQKKCIIFLDEAEILLKKRGQSRNSKYDDDTSNAFLALLDGVSTKKDTDIVWVVATNFDDANTQMDDAALRRFHIKINFRLPNKEERKNILNFYISKKEKSDIAPDLDLSHIAEVTSRLSPALLKSITDTASIIAINEGSPLNNEIMMRAFERVLLGLTDRKTTEKLDNDRRLIAIHELGHFFMHFNNALEKNNGEFQLEKIKENISVLKISTESLSKGNVLGYVLSKEEEGVLFTKRDLENRIKVLYGGVANEEIFFGKDNITTGSYNDISEITKIINHIYIELGMYGGAKVNRFFIGNRNNESSANVNEESFAQIDALANHLYEETKNTLSAYKDLVNIVTPILLERYVLSIDDILAIVVENKEALKTVFRE